MIPTDTPLLMLLAAADQVGAGDVANKTAEPELTAILTMLGIVVGAAVVAHVVVSWLL